MLYHLIILDEIDDMTIDFWLFWNFASMENMWR